MSGWVSRNLRIVLTEIPDTFPCCYIMYVYVLRLRYNRSEQFTFHQKLVYTISACISSESANSSNTVRKQIFISSSDGITIFFRFLTSFSICLSNILLANAFLSELAYIRLPAPTRPIPWIMDASFRFSSGRNSRVKPSSRARTVRVRAPGIPLIRPSSPSSPKTATFPPGPG